MLEIASGAEALGKGRKWPQPRRKPQSRRRTDAGRIVQIIGPCSMCSSKRATSPQIYDALVVKREDGTDVIAEVQQHLGNNWVRAVSMAATDGLRRGMKAVATGGPITVPVGEATLGRLFNVIGERSTGRVR